MNKACYFIAFLALLNICPVSAAERSYPIVEPRVAGTEISKLLADARPDEAAAALAKDLHPTPETQFSFEQLTSAFRIVAKNGKADVQDEVKSVTYGRSVMIIVDYLHFPHPNIPVNQFVFLRYTFLKSGDGWIMANFDFKASSIFPPPGWGN
jgi:hypothetical protein